MGNNNQFIQIAPGIRLVGEALVADVRLGSARHGSQRRITKRFTRGTPEFDEFDRAGTVTKLTAWQYQQKHDLTLAAPGEPERGTFDGDVPTFLRLLPEGKYRDETVRLLAHWSAALIPQERRHPIRLGSLSRSDLTRQHILAVLSGWENAGVATGSRNKRLSRVRVFYQTLNGITEPNPTDKITFTKEPEVEPRDVPVHIIKTILDALPNLGCAARGEPRPPINETKLRLTVMAWTGMAPATLQRVTTRHLDLAHARLYLTARRKGKGTPGRWVPLIPPAVEALQAFVAAGLIGTPASNMWRTWHTAIARATKTALRHAEDTGDRSWLDALDNLPPNSKPYDLRHSFASEVYRRTGDITAVKELLQHANLKTTERYTGGAVSERAAIAVTKAAVAYTNIPTIPPAPTKADRARASMRLVRKTVKV